MKTWTVIAKPVGKLWHIEVDGLPGATQARSSKEIHAMARDFIGLSTGTDPKRVEIALTVGVPDDVQRILEHAQELTRVADRARKEAAQEARRAARALRDSGLTVRDVGFALGVSFQRAQQLIKH